MKLGLMSVLVTLQIYLKFQINISAGFKDTEEKHLGCDTRRWHGQDRIKRFLYSSPSKLCLEGIISRRWESFNILTRVSGHAKQTINLSTCFIQNSATLAHRFCTSSLWDEYLIKVSVHDTSFQGFMRPGDRKYNSNLNLVMWPWPWSRL